MEKTIEQSIELELPSSTRLVYVVDAVISEILRDMGFDEETSEQINLAVIEAAMNAIKHGNNEDLEKKTHFQFILNQEELTIVIEDEGNGFDRENVADPLSPANLLKSSGRGIFLMEACMDSVTFESSGRVVRMVKTKSVAS